MAFNPVALSGFPKLGLSSISLAPPPPQGVGALEQPYLEYQLDGAPPEYALSGRASMEVRHDGYISGTVLVEGLPAPYAVVRLYYRPTGKLLYETRCDAGGNFSFTRLADLQSENHYVVALDPEGGYSYNAKIFDKLKPVSTASWQVRPLSMCGGYCGAPGAYHNPTGLSANDALQGLPSNYFTQFNQGFEFHPERLNDGVKLSVSSPFGPTLGWVHGGNQPIQNDNRGINFSLLSAKALGRIQLSATPAEAGVRACNIVVSALVVGVGWQVVATQALQAVPTSGDEYGYQTIDLPPNSPSAVDWRIHLESWAWLTGSWMCGEVKAYEWLTAVDPHWASVITLLHFDGEDGATSIVDQKGGAWSRVGSPGLTTTDKKFGSASLQCASSGQFSASLGASVPAGGSLSVEFWLKLGGSGRQVLLSNDSGSDRWWIEFNRNSGGELTFIWGNITGYGSVALNIGQWYHVAAVRYAGGYMDLFIDGVRDSVWGADTRSLGLNNIVIGGMPAYFGGAFPSTAKFDDLRITKADRRVFEGGLWKYPVPPAAHPDS